MGAYVLRRILSVIPVIFVVSVVVFLLIYLIPGDPASVLLGTNATEEQIRLLQERMGLDQPLYVQFYKWITNMLVGNMGESLIWDKEVSELIFSRLPVTLLLICYALLISMIIAFPLGILAAVRHNSGWDYTSMVIALIGVSIPNFWLGLILIMLFALHLGWFPSNGYSPISEGMLSHLKYMALPAFALGFLQAGIVTRMTRSSMLEVLKQDYIRTVRAKGGPEWNVIFKHAFKNAMIPIITILGINFGLLLGGTIIVEQIFSIPGLGQLLLSAVYNRDYPLIQGIVLVIAFLNVMINLITDLLYILFDPKIDYSKG